MKLDIVKLSRKWDGLHIRKSVLERALRGYDLDIAVALSTDSHIKELNAGFRGKDKPTNVLSFTNDQGGDVILAIETIRRESKQMNKPLRHHIEHLIVHGALHIAGYDHENDNDANVMEAKETAICGEIGFDPYTY